jgi:hypothetical protein
MNGVYLAEFDFRYSNRVKLGFTDGMRADKAMKGHRWKAVDVPET